jgi:hypothetical protein
MSHDRNPHLLHMRFKFPKGCHDGRGKALESIVVRETDGVDEENAARAADGAGKKGNFQLELFKEGVVSIVLSGQEVQVAQPFASFDVWPTRSKEFALRAFAKLNAVAEAEELGEGVAVDTKTKSTATSP